MPATKPGAFETTDEFVLFSERMVTVRSETETGPGAVLVRNGRIAEVITGTDVDSIAHAKVIDLHDKPLLPGFVDPHAHSEVMARTEATTVDCRAPGCTTIADVLDTLHNNLGAARDGWLVGQANLFFDQKLTERRLPTREELDIVSREVAIALRCGGHLTVLNSRGLERAGITASSGSEFGSITGRPSVELDSTGAPTGVVKEMDRLLPLPGLDDRGIERAIADGLERRFTRLGVTTVGEIAESQTGLRAFDRLLADGAPIPRMRMYLWAPGFAPLEEAIAFSDGYIPLAGDGQFAIHGVKVFADGGYSAKSAAMTRPYRDLHDHHGETALSAEGIATTMLTTDRHGLQLAIHANGDRAQLLVASALAGVRPQLSGLVPAPRIEHAGNFVPDYDTLTTAWAAAGVIPVPQPVFIYNFGEFVPAYVGDYANQGQFPLRTLLADGWDVSGSSDVWVGSEQAQTNPFLSIASAVRRLGFHGDVLEGDEAVTPMQAIRMHTLAGARAMGLENEIGSIEVGKRADFIVLDRDPLTIDASEYLDIGVEQTFRDGLLL